MSPHIFCIVLVFLSPAFAIDEISKKNKECATNLNVWVQDMTAFEGCVVRDAVPVRYCSKCVDEYVLFVQSYQKFATSNDSLNEHKCIERYIGQDSLNVVWTSYRHAVDLWEDAACTSCFSDKCDPNSFPEKGNVTELCTPSQHVIDTNSTINELQKCINESENFCTDCQHQFSTMDNLQLFKDGHKFCFEMVFKANQTIHKWNMKCPKSQESAISVAAIAIIASIFALISVAAHVGYKYYRRHQEYIIPDEDVPCLN